jgi:aminopeptidase N
VITPAHPIQRGATFTVTVAYTGRPGVHLDGDGSTEGWFRSNSPVGDGGFVTTEPVGSEDWMPLNDHPSAKPSYDLYATVNAGKTAIGNGVLISRATRAGNAQFPHGSTTWHWRSNAPVASYLVEASVGSFDLTRRTTANGMTYYQGQASSLSATRKRANRSIMNQQSDITAFESTFNGPFPFQSDGVLIGLPKASFAEEMQTMITFPGGRIDLDTLYHENMHQWWGDNVTEANYNLTFFKEGMATLGEFLFAARTAEQKAGGPGTKAGTEAFEASLRQQFDTLYANAKVFTTAPSNPTPYGLFSGASTYDRPGIAYIALRQILGPAAFARTLQSVQARYGGSTITEAEWESAFMQALPNQSAQCRSRLGTFFRQWFDTDYPTSVGVTRPTLTGPGLDGGGFSC